MQKARVYDMLINDNDETGVDINSFVSAPAHMRSFETYAKGKIVFAVDTEKRMVTGVFILANTLIYRNDNQLGEHYVKFSPDVIEKIRNKFFKQGYNVNTNVEHSVAVKGATLVESYIVNSKDPRYAKTPEILSKQNVTDGSWVGSYHVDNEALWQDCKKGVFTGFSVEGYFDKKELLTKNQKSAMKKEEKKKGIFAGIAANIFGSSADKFKEVTAVDGTILQYEGDLAQGTAVMSEDDKGNPVPAKAGDYQVEMEDEKNYAITVDDKGIVTAMTEVAAMSAEAEALSAAVKKVYTDAKTQFTAMQKEIDALKKEIGILKGDKKFSAKGKKDGKDPEDGKEKKGFRTALGD